MYESRTSISSNFEFQPLISQFPHVAPPASTATCRSFLDLGAGGAGDLRLACCPSIRSGVKPIELGRTRGRRESGRGRGGAEISRRLPRCAYRGINPSKPKHAYPADVGSARWPRGIRFPRRCGADGKSRRSPGNQGCIGRRQWPGIAIQRHLERANAVRCRPHSAAGADSRRGPRRPNRPRRSSKFITTANGRWPRCWSASAHLPACWPGGWPAESVGNSSRSGAAPKRWRRGNRWQNFRCRKSQNWRRWQAR